MNDEVYAKTGVYIAYPTSSVLKSIYKPKNYKTKVNDQHTKIGIAKDCFHSRRKGYLGNFNNEVEFIPIALIDARHLEHAEKLIICAISIEFAKVGRAREWFNTANRQRISEIINSTLSASGIEHAYIG